MEFKRRKQLRLNNYDYSNNGAYFITVCTQGRRNILSRIIVGEGFHPLPIVELTKIGIEIENTINFINDNYRNVFIEKYVIMPNHIHLILHLGYENLGGHGNPPLQKIVGQLKSFTTKKYEKLLWQRSYYDHIIRNDMEYAEIWSYIDSNPSKWLEDEYFTEG
ncbi:MAG: transposase [Oscillospiraceae bacterium]|nr:transposase [Oscillospiraceae bacterium]